MGTMLQVEALHKSYPTRAGELRVLSGVDLTLVAGQSAAILGPSGSGKSTLLNILGTLEPPTAGRVTLDDCDPFTLTERELARFRNRQIGFVFQDHHLLPQCSVLENVLVPTLAGGPADDAETRARQLLSRVGLSERLDHRPAELSGGEKQRVALARALTNRPRLVLADEPTGNLDRQTADSVAELLVALPCEQDAVLVLVTHSETLARRCDCVFDLVAGILVPRQSS
jgi:lipoprotein-releasing system ATP-binding protein